MRGTMSEAAWQEAGRLLGRKPRTEHELTNALRQRGHDEADVARTLERLRAQRWLDDARLAREAVLTRTARGFGRARILAELRGRGVAREVAEAAWDEAVASGELDPEAALERRLARRLRGRSAPDERELRRMYNALLRAGHEESAVRRALEQHLDRSRRDGD
jgi:regulatory protein